MGSSHSKLVSGEGYASNLIDHQEAFNKFRTIDYSCYELLHTWSPSCSQVSHKFIMYCSFIIIFFFLQYIVLVKENCQVHFKIHSRIPLFSLQSMVEVGGLSFREGLKIYTSVYAVRYHSILCDDIAQFVIK